MNYVDADKSENLEEIRIILLGRTGGGKSAFGNSICGSQEKNVPFESGISSSSVTQIPKIAYREYADRKLCVIDTPGLFNTNRSNDETMEQLIVAFRIAKPGPHAFLIVLCGRCTNEEMTVLDLLKKKFGQYFMDYCFIIVTREDELRDNDTQSSDDEVIRKYFQEAPQILQEFLMKCNSRCFLIDNRASFEERERKIAMIIEMIKHNEQQHANTFFNQEMFDQAERYDREWNNHQFDHQQKEIQKEVETTDLREEKLFELYQKFSETRRQIIEPFFDEKHDLNAKEEALSARTTAKILDTTLRLKNPTFTDENQSD